MKKLIFIALATFMFSTSQAQIGQPPVDSLCAIEMQDTITFHVPYGLILYASSYMKNSDELTAAIAQATSKLTQTETFVDVVITEQLVIDILYTLGSVPERIGAEPNKVLKSVLMNSLSGRPCLLSKLSTYFNDNNQEYTNLVNTEKMKIDKVRKYLSNND